ncbi:MULTISPECIES: PEP-CTERM sorting domain-containing protein [unclassified Colwellia]|uniref:PEP-CTERM sorting domain-containing protein n=1 Tax=unclassified Colwellia TaxID=196834 RepID=UPI0015F36C9B|nr:MULTISPECIES: PEP-CTERM sorting domain-containing protein [unclassified Colwellia]MBA6231773.1 PEP-CTERM sorting domain-containing protein [Colwellia sp. MB02u-7]MBA6235728.1 PEP-CTERM sorting domain-containing protein [Colwellia sp. MB02u-11]MBA6257509.1 PEP-CTERM sorting domain-containing protein [Colwellia sp. MB3u-28]MBA6260581.1 PEP-CTERM sorting domain-containing protein [Colwellia sp. MB3u-41]MBA6298817.1 PEP-CTERM sorting domain-containing protein [Colwellia sp. MB3u-22]
MKLKIHSILSRWAAAMITCIIVVTTSTAHAELIIIETNLGSGTNTVMFDDTLGKLVEVKYSFDVSITFSTFNDEYDGYTLDCGPLDVCARYKTASRAISVDAVGDYDGTPFQDVANDFEIHSKGALDLDSNVWNYRTSNETIFGDLSGAGIQFYESRSIEILGSWEIGLTGGTDQVWCGAGYSRRASCFDTAVSNQRITLTYDNAVVEVNEPATLAIFALGMIGLASRRYKKQS